MRSYCIDELEPKEMKKLAKHLKDLELDSSLEGVFWLEVPEGFLTIDQKDHIESCSPYCLALVLEGDCVFLEFLVRSLGKMHCNCMSYADSKLRNHFMDWLDNQLDKLSIDN